MTSFIFKKRHEQANAANVQMTEAEAALAQSDFNIEKITEIQNKFTGGAVLCVPGRIFIREGTLWKVCRKGPKKRQFFLFNDIMVYGSVVANRYSNQHILPLSHMSVSAECHYQPTVQASFNFGGEHLDEQLDVANAFQISHSNKSFHVFALSSADKSNWLSNLNKHITRVAQSANRGKASARAVWVPDSMTKECMSCNQKFTPFVRKHHCRQCGRILCSNCSPHRVNLGKAAAGETKLERVCKECFKGMFKPMQQANDEPDGSEPRDLTSPPPASVAAKLVSSVLRGHSNKQQQKDGDSTDTEDTDDSEDERKEHVPLRATTVVGKPAAPSSEIKRSKSDVTRTRVKPVEERPSSASLEPPSPDEPHPTPPPRKKKLMKMKQQKQEQSPPVAEKVTMATNSTDPGSTRTELPSVTDKQTDTQQESHKDDPQHPATASAKETEGSPKEVDTLQGSPKEVDTLQGSPKEVDTLQGSPKEVDTPEGSPKEVDTPEGSPKDGDTLQGSPKDGDTQQGSPKDDDTLQGSPKDGDTQQGSPKDGDTQQGSPKDGDTQHPQTTSDREPIQTDGGDFPKDSQSPKSPTGSKSPKGNQRPKDSQSPKGSQSPKRPRRKKKYVKPEEVLLTEQHGDAHVELGTEVVQVPIEQPASQPQLELQLQQPSTDSDRGQQTEEPPLEDTIPGEAQPSEQSESHPGPKRPRGRKQKFKAPEAD